MQIRNVLLTGTLFCGPLFLVSCCLNTEAFAYGTTHFKPFHLILLIYLITFFMLTMGGIAGKTCKYDFKTPCSTTKHPRDIPLLPWYRTHCPRCA